MEATRGRESVLLFNEEVINGQVFREKKSVVEVTPEDHVHVTEMVIDDLYIIKEHLNGQEMTITNMELNEMQNFYDQFNEWSELNALILEWNAGGDN